jgi:hypothetical protein
MNRIFSKIINEQRGSGESDIQSELSMSGISYGHQWIITIIFIISVLIAISAGIIFSIKIWRKRK